MAQVWEAKSPDEIVERRWSVPLDRYDAISTVAATGSGVTVDDASFDLGDALITLSGGSVGDASVAVTVTSVAGLTLKETFLIAIRDSGVRYTNTVNDVCAFALRKVVGIGETASPDEQAMAVEMLNDMLAQWRIEGLDVGVTSALESGDTVPCPEEYLSAIKYNLTVLLAEEFDRPLTPTLATMASEGKRLIANRLCRIGDLSAPDMLSGARDRIEDYF